MLVWLLEATETWAGRPLETEDPDTVEPRQAELELSGDYARNPEDMAWELKGVLSVGVLPRVEARLEFPLLLLTPDAEDTRGGIGDSLFGLKYRLLDEAERRPAVLGAFMLRLPTGDATQGLGADGVDVGFLLVVSKRFGPVTLTWNGGYTFGTRHSAPDVWGLAGAVAYQATQAWSLVGEVVRTWGAGREEDTAVLRSGAVYAITDALRLDGAVGFGITPQSPDVMVTLGITIALSKRGAAPL